MTYNLKKILSFSSISIILGVFGLLSGFTGLYYSEMAPIPFWIFITVVWFFLSVLIILVKFIYDGFEGQNGIKSSENPISYNEDIGCFLIKSNPNFTGQVLVGCYANNDGYEQLAYVGNVHHVQDSALQIKIIKDMNILENIPNTQAELRKLEIRPVVPFAAISQISEV